MAAPAVIGVAGGTGSGKTTIVQRMIEGLDPSSLVVLQHDSYYRDRSHLPLEERSQINYDHPESLQNDLLVHHLQQLVAGSPVSVPVYDFVTHTRRPESTLVEPSPIIVLEGILILAVRELRGLMDVKIFVDTDDDVRFIRRMERDICERGRSRQEVVQQYLSTVRPMHLEYVEPSRRFADVIIPEGGYNDIAVDLLVTKLQALLG